MQNFDVLHVILLIKWHIHKSVKIRQEARVMVGTVQGARVQRVNFYLILEVDLPKLHIDINAHFPVAVFYVA